MFADGRSAVMDDFRDDPLLRRRPDRARRAGQGFRRRGAGLSRRVPQRRRLPIAWRSLAATHRDVLRGAALARHGPQRRRCAGTAARGRPDGRRTRGAAGDALPENPQDAAASAHPPDRPPDPVPRASGAPAGPAGSPAGDRCRRCAGRRTWPCRRPRPAARPGGRRSGRGDFTFLNRRERIGFVPDWNPAGCRCCGPGICTTTSSWASWQLAFEDVRAVVLDWIRTLPAGAGTGGLEAYPTSLRLVNWCALLFGLHRERTLADGGLSATLWASLWSRRTTLRRRLEWRLMGNHLLENAVALSLAGSCFDHPSAAAWRRTGRALLAASCRRRFWPMAGTSSVLRCTRRGFSTSCLLLQATADRGLQDLVRPHLPPLARALAALTHPDGEIALLNDSAFGVVPRPADLTARAGVSAPRAGVLRARRERVLRCANGGWPLRRLRCRSARVRTGSRGTAMPTCSRSSCPCAAPGSWSTAASPRMRAAGCATTADRPARTTRSRFEGEGPGGAVGGFQSGAPLPAPRAVDWRVREHGFELSGWHEGYRSLPARPDARADVPLAAGRPSGDPR